MKLSKYVALLTFSLAIFAQGCAMLPMPMSAPAKNERIRNEMCMNRTLHCPRQPGETCRFDTCMTKAGNELGNNLEAYDEPSYEQCIREIKAADKCLVEWPEVCTHVFSGPPSRAPYETPEAIQVR